MRFPELASIARISKTYRYNEHRHHPSRHHDEPEPLVRRTIRPATSAWLVDTIDESAEIQRAALGFGAVAIAGGEVQCCVVGDVLEERT